jgi:hypothetical protein
MPNSSSQLSLLPLVLSHHPTIEYLLQALFSSALLWKSEAQPSKAAGA